MFQNKTKAGLNNICGQNLARYRKAQKLSQRELAEQLQVLGLDIDKNAIQRMEAGKRFITDIELVYLSRALNQSLEALMDTSLLF